MRKIYEEQILLLLEVFQVGCLTQASVPSFDCKKLMLVMLIDTGLESAAVKLVWCLLPLNIGELDKMCSCVLFLCFYELFDLALFEATEHLQALRQPVDGS